MFNGRISLGPRYCPSIEDKINRFADKETSVVYEPEGWKTCEVYVNGFLHHFQQIFNLRL
jgi:tRNA uridine 5-carboxymethylaminomethyl modification enzyme